MFKHGYRYDEAETEVAGYKIPLGIIPIYASRRRRGLIMWCSISWFVAAARGECEGGNQEEERFCLVHIAYFLFRAAEVTASGMGSSGMVPPVQPETDGDEN